ncbi:ATP-binding protein [Pseudoalteromonas sp. MMG005]|uniref:ATP-binding protein n=1 Tax=Pseudoalteromonas sp. MMG005 TaxID=2822682 RepID=UPI001B39FCF6|nr:ATP-binding protein [Pseudoalteromonas sp. MMG005]MBQ4845267.1 AAA family ATPase [Pseudoalteromonas sp. MMG005]
MASIQEEHNATVAAERHLAQCFYAFGLALKEANEDLESAATQLHNATTTLAKTTRFLGVKAWFDLTDSEVTLLALVYIQTLDPDCVAPFIGLSWFEQGPTLSLDKLLTLNDKYLSKRTLLAENIGSSRLFTLGLLNQSSHYMSLSCAVQISPLLQQYLQSGCVSSSDGALFSVIKKYDIDPVFSCSFAKEQHKIIAKYTLLNHDNAEQALWYGMQLAAHSTLSVSQFIGEAEEGKQYDSQILLVELAELLLKNKGQSVVIYWPNWVNYLHIAYQNLRAIIQHLPQVYIVTMAEPQQRKHDIEHVDERVIVMPTQEKVASSWLALAPESQARLEARAWQLATHYPIALERMNTLSQHAIQLMHTPEDYWSTLQAQCLQTQSLGGDELAKLSQSRFTLQDMVLANSMAQPLKELVARVRYQAELKARLPRLNRGCKALFWGKPGTGKSMAAEAIAGELQLPLYLVNLANIASKWIGETEKHLAKLFDSAERHNAVLMFDEADAIFAKRSEVESSHDKNANMGVSYLLQRMEHYSGLLLLSTNFKANLDEAFLRRFHNVVEFTFPTETERMTLWLHSLGGNADDDLLGAITPLAHQFELSAAQIINITETALLQSLMAGRALIVRSDIACALKRELAKHHAGFMAQQDILKWLQGGHHGPNAIV